MARSRHGRRRRSGNIGQPAPTPREIQREARSEAARLARRRILFATVAAVLIVVGTVSVASWVNRTPDVSPPDVESPPDSGASLLLGLTDEGGSLVSIGLVASHSVEESRLVLFPPSLAVVLPGYGERDLADAVLFGGPDLLRLTIANLLGIRVDSVGVAEVGAFAASVGGPISVDLTKPLIVSDAGGETVAYGQGVAERSIEDLTRLFSEQGTGDQLALLVRQSSVWEAVFDAAAADGAVLSGLLASVEQSSDVAYQALSTAVVADPLLVSAVPTNRVVGVGPSTERYTVSTEEGAAFVVESFDYLQLADEPRLRVEILNGNGLVGTTAPVARVLIEAGFRVVFTDNADRQDYETSRLIAQGSENQSAAVAIQRLLGTGEVFLEQRQPSGVVDLTIIVGSDLAVQG